MKTRNWIIFWGAFIVSTIGLCKYSSLPSSFSVGTLLFQIFDKPKSTDGVALSLCTGYIVSAIFFLMVVYFPEKRRAKKVLKVVIQDLFCVCNDAIMLLICIYKNVCTEDEWGTISIKSDNDFFDEAYYTRMRRFDAYADADSLLVEECDDGTIRKNSWDDKLKYVLTEMHSQLNQILAQYAYLLDEDLIGKILSFRNNKFSTVYLGLPTNQLYMQYTGVDGAKYAERLPLYLVREIKAGKKTPLFANAEVDNIVMLKDFVDTLLELWKICAELPGFSKEIAIKNYCNDGCGKTNCAVFVNS